MNEFSNMPGRAEDLKQFGFDACESEDAAAVSWLIEMESFDAND